VINCNDFRLCIFILIAPIHSFQVIIEGCT
jgi:hypothetical protein